MLAHAEDAKAASLGGLELFATRHRILHGPHALSGDSQQTHAAHLQLSEHV